jgi:hypothetical protein
MLIKGIIDEDFVNFRKPSMVIMCPTCSFKCDKEFGEQVCQNGALATSPNIEVDYSEITQRYLQNPITKAIVFSGLEALDSITDIYFLVTMLRANGCEDDVVIYTGYTEDEVADMKTDNNYKYINILKSLKPIIIKYGRYKPHGNKHYDEVLGVNLASDNQYAVKYE